MTLATEDRSVEFLGAQLAVHQRRQGRVKGETWWCPFCDTSSQTSVARCKKCNAELEGVEDVSASQRVAIVVSTVTTTSTVPTELAEVILGGDPEEMAVVVEAIKSVDPNTRRIRREDRRAEERRGSKESRTKVAPHADTGSGN